MGDRERGLYQKFTVQRTDGSDKPNGKHDGCEYFVLDLTHDKFAIPALEAYARACRNEYPLLAADLVERRLAAQQNVAPQVDTGKPQISPLGTAPVSDQPAVATPMSRATLAESLSVMLALHDFSPAERNELSSAIVALQEYDALRATDP